MDFEFRKNTFDGQFHVQCSMGHEAMGRWLIDEIGSDKQALLLVLEHIQRIQSSGGQWFREGRAFHLQLDCEAAEVTPNTADQTDDESLMEQDLYDYDAEQMAVCGLEDFEQFLLAWQDFLIQFSR